MKSNVRNKQAKNRLSQRGANVQQTMTGLALALLLGGCQSPQSEPAADSVPPAGPAPAPITDVSAPAADTSAAACPSQDFNEFLKAFSGDTELQDKYTEGQVKANAFSDDDSYEVEQVLVDKDAYDGFRLLFRNDGFHVVEGDGEASPGPVQVDVEGQDGNRYVVSYQYGSSEGRSYLFIPNKNCWVLSEDQTLPSP